MTEVRWVVIDLKDIEHDGCCFPSSPATREAKEATYDRLKELRLPVPPDLAKEVEGWRQT